MTYALSIVGANERILAERLGVREGELVNYLMGVEEIPTEIFLKAVDVVLAATAEDLRVSRSILEQIRRQDLTSPGSSRRTAS